MLSFLVCTQGINLSLGWERDQATFRAMWIQLTATRNQYNCAKHPIRNWFQMQSRTCRLNSVIRSSHMVGGFRNACSARPSYTWVDDEWAPGTQNDRSAWNGSQTNIRTQWTEWTLPWWFSLMYYKLCPYWSFSFCIATLWSHTIQVLRCIL